MWQLLSRIAHWLPASATPHSKNEGNSPDSKVSVSEASPHA